MARALIVVFFLVITACTTEQPNFRQRADDSTNTEIVRQTQFSATRFAITSPTPSRTPQAIQLRPTPTRRFPLTASEALTRIAEARSP